MLARALFMSSLIPCLRLEVGQGPCVWGGGSQLRPGCVSESRWGNAGQEDAEVHMPTTPHVHRAERASGTSACEGSVARGAPAAEVEAAVEAGGFG